MLTQEKLNFIARNGMVISTFHFDDEIPSSEFYRGNNFLESLKNTIYNGFKASLRENNLLEIAEELVAVLCVRLVSTNNNTYKNTISSNRLILDKITTFKSVKILKASFSQKYNNVSVYGAKVTVEVDKDNKLLAINSAMGVDINVNPSPTIKSSNLKSLIESQTGRNLNDSHLTSHPYYYFDSKNDYWRLVYFVENNLKDRTKFCGLEKMQERVDYIIDAHAGDIISQHPRFTTTFSQLGNQW
jgi:Zn-dependent metalloprotease